jgi:hypothetical protein
MGIRWGLALLLVLTAAGIGWLRGGYEKSPDPAARFRIDAVELRRDHSFFWLDLTLDRAGDEDHDLQIPVRLKTAAGRSVEPANTEMTGSPERGTTGLRIKFWLEAGDFPGPLELELNGGRLRVRTGSGVPDLENGARRKFRHNRW